MRKWFPAKKKIGVRASAPLEIIHMDCSRFVLPDGVKLWIHVIRDNYSRALLGTEISHSASSAAAVTNLKAVCERYGFNRRPVTLLVDDGSENKGEVIDFVEHDQSALTRVVARADVSFSNSMVENMIKIIKHQGLIRANPRSRAEVARVLAEITVDFNNRPLNILEGLTPNEVLAGKRPDKYRFMEDIKRASRDRKEVNRSEDCENDT